MSSGDPEALALKKPGAVAGLAVVAAVLLGLGRGWLSSPLPIEATLEVRLSNLPARRLYEKYGFRPVGIRPRYYSDDHEDALIMTTEPLASPGMRARLTALGAELAALPDPEPPEAPLPGAAR